MGMSIERRLRKETQINDNQFDFIFEMLIMKVIYLSTTTCDGAISYESIRIILNFH